MPVQVKGAREGAARSDGYRVLVDRMWPRGVSKDSARLDEWARELAPSDELRRWYRHDPDRFAEFRRRYIDELNGQRSTLSQLRTRARQQQVTLVVGARDVEHSNGRVLDEFLAAYETEHGEITADEVRDATRRARARAVIVRSGPDGSGHDGGSRDQGVA